MSGGNRNHVATDPDHSHYWDFDKWAYDEFTNEMDGISGGMKNTIRSRDADVGVDEYRIVFAKAPPTKYKKYLDDNGISYEIVDSVPQLQQ